MVHALHGNFGLPADWNTSIMGMADARAWNLWEIRRQFPEARTLEGFARWFNRTVGELPGREPRTLAGYSLGGRLALHVLIDRPELWSRALFISTHPGLEHPGEKAARFVHDQQWQQRCLTEQWETLMKDWDRQPVLQTTSPSGPPALTEPWREEIASGFSDWSLGKQRNLLPILAELKTPTVWVAGAADGKFSALSQVAASRLPGSLLIIIPNAGHRILHENPDAIRILLGGENPPADPP